MTKFIFSALAFAARSAGTALADDQEHLQRNAVPGSAEASSTLTDINTGHAF